MEPDGTRAVLVRRNTIRLVIAQGALMSAVSVVFVLGVVAIVDFSDRERWGGVFLAEFNVAAAASAIVVGRLMDRVGRRPGLVMAYVLLGAGGIGAAAAVASASPWALLAMALPLGAGLGAGQLGRVAVADMYPSDHRGRMIGIVIAGGTVGAIGGPPLAAGIEATSSSDVAPWLLVPAVALIGLAAVFSLRPDPRELAVEERVVDTGHRRSPRELLRLTPFRAAVVAVGIAQTAMVAVMGVTPVVLDDRGRSSLTIALVISAHLAGMFAMAPVIGYLLDRYGRRRGLLVGTVLSASGALLGSFAEAAPLVGVGLFLVGLGWSACFLGATATISDVTAARERGGALGFTDLFTSLASAVGALTGGFVLEAAGIAVVGATMAVLMLPVLLMVLPLREPSPGRWRLTPPGAASYEA